MKKGADIKAGKSRNLPLKAETFLKAVQNLNHCLIIVLRIVGTTIKEGIRGYRLAENFPNPFTQSRRKLLLHLTKTSLLHLSAQARRKAVVASAKAAKIGDAELRARSFPTTTTGTEAGAERHRARLQPVWHEPSDGRGHSLASATGGPLRLERRPASCPGAPARSPT